MSTWNAETKHKLNETLGIKYALASPIEFTLPLINWSNQPYLLLCISWPRNTVFRFNNSLAQCRITMKFLHNFF